jgi:phosphoribosylanthranilate isomerase
MITGAPSSATGVDTGPTRFAHTCVKICGLTRAVDVDAAVAFGANAVGFVLYPKSPRYVPPEVAAELARHLPPLVTPVLLFVNATPTQVRDACGRFDRCILQFHGDESAADCTAIATSVGRPYWRAARVPVNRPFDLLKFAADYRAAQALLLDAEVPGYGGGGRRFDWSLLPARIPAHVVLSGGLTAENVRAGIQALRGRSASLTVDVSSGVEATDAAGRPLKGVKDADKIRHFIAAVRAADDSCSG